MYENFFGFRELPFALTPNPRYLFLTAHHREALCNLQYGITARRGITLLLGDAGTGKTTLVQTALGLVRQDNSRCVYLNNPTLTRAEFVEFLADGFDLSGAAASSKTRLLRELERLLIERLAGGVASALLIDEAQSLSHELLEEIRLLANMETATSKLLPVVLAGQPELAARLNEPSLRHLKQRVALRCELWPLQLHETAAYIAARIERAGGRSAQVFTKEAVDTIHDRSRGIPRTISVICDNALISGFAADRRPVSQEIVREVCRDLDFERNDEKVSGSDRVEQEPAARNEQPAVENSLVAQQGSNVVRDSRDGTEKPDSFGRRGRFSFF